MDTKNKSGRSAVIKSKANIEQRGSFIRKKTRKVLDT